MIMHKDRLIDYLEFAKLHYTGLAQLMTETGNNKYATEHLGKVKFIELLLSEIEQGVFDV